MLVADGPQGSSAIGYSDVKTTIATIVGAILCGCSTPVRYTLYDDGTKHFDFDYRPAPTNKVEVGCYEAIHKPPLGTRMTIIAG